MAAIQGIAAGAAATSNGHPRPHHTQQSQERSLSMQAAPGLSDAERAHAGEDAPPQRVRAQFVWHR